MQQYQDALRKLKTTPGQSSELYQDLCRATEPSLQPADVVMVAEGDYHNAAYLNSPLVPSRYDPTDVHGYRKTGNASDVIDVKVQVRKAAALWGPLGATY
jgi:hypothetical protein